MCTSSNVKYMLECSFCYKQYVGEAAHAKLAATAQDSSRTRKFSYWRKQCEGIVDRILQRTNGALRLSFSVSSLPYLCAVSSIKVVTCENCPVELREVLHEQFRAVSLLHKPTNHPAHLLLGDTSSSFVFEPSLQCSFYCVYVQCFW